MGRLGDKASLRSDQVVKEGKIGDAMSDEYIEMALRNQSGGGIKTGSTGEKEFVRYDPLPIEGLNWCMITTTAGTVTQIEQIATVINGPWPVRIMEVNLQWWETSPSTEYDFWVGSVPD